MIIYYKDKTIVGSEKESVSSNVSLQHMIYVILRFQAIL